LELNARYISYKAFPASVNSYSKTPLAALTAPKPVYKIELQSSFSYLISHLSTTLTVISENNKKNV